MTTRRARGPPERSAIASGSGGKGSAVRGHAAGTSRTFWSVLECPPGPGAETSNARIHTSFASASPEAELGTVFRALPPHRPYSGPKCCGAHATRHRASPCGLTGDERFARGGRSPRGRWMTLPGDRVVRSVAVDDGRGLPSFASPPVVETVLGVQFVPLVKLFTGACSGQSWALDGHGSRRISHPRGLRALRRLAPSGPALRVRGGCRLSGSPSDAKR